MHDLAIVSKIQAIRPIEGKDRIVIASVENYNTIISKDEYKVGDTVVYVFYDAILPADNPDFEFLRTKCYSSKLNGFRIRPMRMGGEVSEGLILPMSVLPKNKEYSIGQVVTDDLKIRRFETEIELPSGIIGRYPDKVPKSDEDNIEKMYINYPNWKGIEFYVTEKIEGTAATWIYEGDTDSLRIFSHNWEVGNSGVWYEASEKTGLKEKMSLYCKNNSLPSLVLQGEVVSPSVQKNIYGVFKADIYVYGVMTIEGKRFSFSEMKKACAEMGLKTVPIISESEYMPDSLDAMLKDCEGRSSLADVPREGVVWRAVSEDCDIHFKVKSRTYKIWFDRKTK